MSELFRTSVVVQESSQLIDYADYMMFIGSCFAQNIGSRFEERLYNVKVNPLGVVYNPTSVAVALIDIANNRLIRDEDVSFYNHLWHSFRLHGSFSSTDKGFVIERANMALVEAQKHLQRCKTLVITFGTAWVYYLKDTNEAVANCHKYPDQAFYRRLLSVDEIVVSWQDVIAQLRAFNPDLRMIFTISPVRHWKDGAHGNNISKATLMLAINQLMNHDSSLEYFPAYEIMMDDLRDYRFYADDMLHPSSAAQDYIFGCFNSAFLDKRAIGFGKESFRLVNALGHRPLQGMTDDYRKFINSTMSKIEALQAKYPLIDAKRLLKNDKLVFNDSN